MDPSTRMAHFNWVTTSNTNAHSNLFLLAFIKCIQKFTLLRSHN